MTTNRIGVWLVTHVSRLGGAPTYWFVAARTSSKATSIVALKKAKPYDELYSALVRWDEKVYTHSEWNPGLEGILGDLDNFGPGKTRPCLQCDGRGVVRHQVGDTFSNFETLKCGTCSGTGVRARKKQGTPTHRK
jgi:hypothetical protein